MLRHDYSWSDGGLGFGAILLAALAVTSFGLHYVTDPISCTLPEHFEFFQVRYALEICYQGHLSTAKSPEVFVPGRGYEGANPESRPAHHKWVSFALGMGALICFLPQFLWSMLSVSLWLDPHALLSTLADNQRQAADHRRHVILRDTAILLQAALKRGNSALTLATLGRKLLACVTCLLQLVLNSGNMTSPSFAVDPFPCHFEIRQMQNVHRFDVMCGLPLNQFHNRCFTFLFYVFLLLFVLGTIDLLLWICRVIIPGLRDAAVQRYLNAMPGGDGDGDSAVSQLYPCFSESLGWDGRLLLALTADYCGPLAAADLTNHLWVIFKDAPLPAPAPALPATTADDVASGRDVF
ncbi:hypothetical protein BaRGS_00022062 [Batillaria attramentaria]|uniref:Innexin n=1 Tax=Batillaria attramentaria TaxID=370345 RepID=A0ABD0KHV1_9CAEN